LAEVGIPGVQRPTFADELPGVCRDDLLTIDGAPLPVRMTGSVADALAGRPLSAERCDPASGAAASSPLPLDRGQHVLRSALGVDAGLDLDGIVLGSEAGGAPLTLGPGGAVPPAEAAGGGGAPKVETVSSGRTSMKLRVTGADAPFWLVLGESHNRGWVASVDGHDLGEGKLVNGYANGWLVDPKDARTLDVTITWTPQRTVWIAFAISGITMLLCTALALGLLTRRRRGLAAQSSEVTRGIALDEPPAFRLPFVATGSRPRGLVIAATAIGAGLVAAVLIKPLPGLLVGLLVLAALLRARWRVVLAIGAPVALGVAALYVLLAQTLYEYPPVFDWPTFFDRVHVLGWLAVALLAADALVEVVRTRHRRPDEPPSSG
jgi:arabinofuranan 3-O-arabinosyltransferase